MKKGALTASQMRILAIAFIDDGAVTDRLFREMNGISRASLNALLRRGFTKETLRPKGGWRLTKEGKELVESWLCR